MRKKTKNETEKMDKRMTSKEYVETSVERTSVEIWLNSAVVFKKVCADIKQRSIESKLTEV